MSSTRHAVMRSPNFMDCGKRPDLTPAHHVDLLTGITESTAGKRIKPVDGRELGCIMMHDLRKVMFHREGAIVCYRISLYGDGLPCTLKIPCGWKMWEIDGAVFP